MCKKTLWVVVAAILPLMLMVSCGRSGATYTVQYRVKANNGADITFLTPQGTEQRAAYIFTSPVYTFKTGEHAHVSAQNRKDAGTVNAEIWVNDKKLKSVSSSGAYVIAATDWLVGDDAEQLKDGNSSGSGMEAYRNQSIAIGGMAAILNAEQIFQSGDLQDSDADGTGEYGSFAMLTNATPPLLDATIGSGTKEGYAFTITTTGTANTDETIWWAEAHPTQYQSTSNKCFYVDETGVIRGTDNGGRPATRASGRDWPEVK
jgi:hypothetical protein